MSIHTILSQMEEEFDKLSLSYKGDIYFSNSNTNENYSKIIGSWESQKSSFKSFFRTFATRIVEEQLIEVIHMIETYKSYFNSTGGDERNIGKNMAMSDLEKELRTKLQKMKGDL